MDGFDLLPDPLILQIFNSVSDIKTLLRCGAVSRRFNSLVPQADSLLLKVDCVISSDSADCCDGEADSFLLFSFLRSIVKSLHDLVSPNPPPPTPPAPPHNSPSQILRRFDRVRQLEIELPSGDLRLEKGAVVRWRAEFGRSLRSCAILGFRAIRDSDSSPSPPSGGSDQSGEEDFARGLKTRVVWTISALIAASARHFLLREVVKEQRELRRLVLKDREDEGTVAMDEAGLAELRSSAAAETAEEEEDDDDVGERNRTRVPSVRMRMRHAPRLELNGGVWVEGATLVVVRPTKDECGGGNGAHQGSDVDDAYLATSAFDEGLYGEAVQALLRTRSYILEMNSF